MSIKSIQKTTEVNRDGRVTKYVNKPTSRDNNRQAASLHAFS